MKKYICRDCGKLWNKNQLPKKYLPTPSGKYLDGGYFCPQCQSCQITPFKRDHFILTQKRYARILEAVADITNEYEEEMIGFPHKSIEWISFYKNNNDIVIMIPCGSSFLWHHVNKDKFANMTLKEMSAEIDYALEGHEEDMEGQNAE